MTINGIFLLELAKESFLSLIAKRALQKLDRLFLNLFGLPFS